MENWQFNFMHIRTIIAHFIKVISGRSSFMGKYLFNKKSYHFLLV